MGNPLDGKGLKHDFLCLSLKLTHSRKIIVKVNMVISPREVKIFSKISHFQIRLLSSNFKGKGQESDYYNQG